MTTPFLNRADLLMFVRRVTYIYCHKKKQNFYRKISVKGYRTDMYFINDRDCLKIDILQEFLLKFESGAGFTKNLRSP